MEQKINLIIGYTMLFISMVVETYAHISGKIGLSIFTYMMMILSISLLIQSWIIIHDIRTIARIDKLEASLNENKNRNDRKRNETIHKQKQIPKNTN